MTLFVTFGSWGEIAPLLEIAIRVKGEFLTTSDWAPRVRKYGVKCHEIDAVKHGDSVDDFISAHLLGRMGTIYRAIEEIAPDSLVASFYCFPAQAYADENYIPLVVTTTSPYYFLEGGKIPSFDKCIREYEQFRSSLGLAVRQPYPLAGVYPWYLHTDIGAVHVGFPELRPLEPLSQEVQEFIKQPYGVVSRGTLVGSGDSQKMVNAIRSYGLKALYLGPHEIDADCSVFLDNHQEAVKRAEVCFTHAGIGTTIDCMGKPMVVSPVSYDQFYNANRLIDLKCAVGVKDSYIRSIDAAMKPRSFLPNFFDLELFQELLGAS